MRQQLILLLTFFSLTLAASKWPRSSSANILISSLAPTSFCKCTCFTNSTIIPLTGPNPSFYRNLLRREDDPVSIFNTTTPRARTCADCNKQFCLNYNLPICKNAEEDNVFTSCFQRDSFKDEVVVCVFIVGTIGLLLWAIARPVVGRWRERRGYAAVGGT